MHWLVQTAIKLTAVFVKSRLYKSFILPMAVESPVTYPPNIIASYLAILKYENPNIGGGLSPDTLGLDHFPIKLI